MSFFYAIKELTTQIYTIIFDHSKHCLEILIIKLWKAVKYRKNDFVSLTLKNFNVNAY